MKEKLKMLVSHLINNKELEAEIVEKVDTLSVRAVNTGADEVKNKIRENMPFMIELGLLTVIFVSDFKGISKVAQAAQTIGDINITVNVENLYLG